MARKSGARRKSGKSRARRKAASPAPRQITSEEALDFIRQMQSTFRRTPRTRKQKAKLQEYLAKFTDQTLKAVGSRVQSDLLLRPARTIRAGDFEKGRRDTYVSRRKPK